MSIEIREFDFRNTAEEEYAAFNECRNLILSEQLPDDPPIPLEETIQWLKHLPEFVGFQFWTARETDKNSVIAIGWVIYPHEHNLHIAQFWINILPEYRKQELGKQFLSKVVETAKRENRSLLMAFTTARIPAGEAFMNQMGAKRGIESHINQLVLADLDPDLLRQWIEKGLERGEEFEIGVWEGVYPDDYIDAIVDMQKLLNQQPRGALEIEDMTFSAEQLREEEKSMLARGLERWTVFVREKQSGKYAGYTEVQWNPNKPKIIRQDMTGVFPEYRNKGLGRWLKAEMLDKVLKERKEAEFVRTTNADINAPMMKINTELGFKPYIAESVWQIKTDKAAQYLES